MSNKPLPQPVQVEGQVPEPVQEQPLSALAVGQDGRILRVDGPRIFRRRLLELGLVPGAQVKLVNVAPLGDPIELEVRGCRLSIRKAEARAILLEVPRRHLKVLS